MNDTDLVILLLGVVTGLIGAWLSDDAIEHVMRWRERRRRARTEVNRIIGETARGGTIISAEEDGKFLLVVVWGPDHVLKTWRDAALETERQLREMGYPSEVVP